ncbi:hypothetical protein JHW43_002625 [Diplocarpon mali]|nr:hypothetical protein JHW43_002625 [Diplocarpon mali]
MLAARATQTERSLYVLVWPKAEARGAVEEEIHKEMGDQNPKCQPICHHIKVHSLRGILRSSSGGRGQRNMAWQCSGRTNTELIDNLFKNGLITSSRVRDAMAKVSPPRHAGIATPRRLLIRPVADSPQGIGHAATISAPHMHAAAAESLLPLLRPGCRVLDVGSGSGYLTAVLGELVGPAPGARGSSETARVVGLEHIQPLRDLGQRNMEKSEGGAAMLGEGRVRFVVGDGRKGWRRGEDDEKGWDAIHVGAAAAALPQELVEQLRSPGRIFIPVEEADGSGQYLWIVDKDAAGVVTKRKTYGVRYVPLTDPPHPRHQ